MIRFAHPEYFIFILAAALFFIFFFFRQQSRKKRASLLAEPSLLAGLMATFSKKKFLARNWLFLSGLLMLALSLPGLKTGTRFEEIKTEGIELVLALDISASMNAQDIKPSRLDKARHTMMNFIQRLSGDRVALILFAGDAFIQCPLTTDYGAILLYLESLRPDFTTSAGTDMISLFERLPDVFPEDDESNDKPVAARAMIIFSDGEHHGADIRSSLKNIQNTPIYTIGIGTDQPVPIPVYNERNEITGFHQYRGQTVTTARNEPLLRMIAEQSGGNYYPSTLDEKEIQLILDELNKMKKAETSHFRFTEYEERFQFFLFPAILLLCLHLMINERAKSKT